MGIITSSLLTTCKQDVRGIYERQKRIKSKTFSRQRGKQNNLDFEKSIYGVGVRPAVAEGIDAAVVVGVGVVCKI